MELNSCHRTGQINRLIMEPLTMGQEQQLLKITTTVADFSQASSDRLALLVRLGILAVDPRDFFRDLAQEFLREQQGV